MAHRTCLNGSPAAATAVLERGVRPIPLGRLPAAALRVMPVRRVQANDTLRGILLILGATVLFSTSDATAKYVTQTLPLIEVAWVRYVVFVLAALAAVLREGAAAFWPRRPLMQLGRGLAIAASALLFLLGLEVLPMADAAAINFVSPLLITALAVPLLGETVGLRRWAALGVGLFGAVLAAQPGTGAFRIGAVFPLLSALAWALAMVMTRSFAAIERPATTLLWTAGTGLAVLSCLLPFDARVPTAGVRLLPADRGGRDRRAVAGGAGVPAGAGVIAGAVFLRATDLVHAGRLYRVQCEAGDGDPAGRRHHCRQRPLQRRGRAGPDVTVRAVAVVSVPGLAGEVPPGDEGRVEHARQVAAIQSDIRQIAVRQAAQSRSAPTGAVAARPTTAPPRRSGPPPRSGGAAPSLRANRLPAGTSFLRWQHARSLSQSFLCGTAGGVSFQHPRRLSQCNISRRKRIGMRGGAAPDMRPSHTQLPSYVFLLTQF